MNTTTNQSRKSKPVTVDGLKAWAHDNREFAMVAVKARAFAEVERERVNAYTRPIFERYGFKDEDGDPITNPERLYNCPDEAACAAYYAECLRAHAEHGWKGNPEYCPALVAEDLQRQAEQALLDSLARFMGMGETWNTWSLESRAKALHLALSSCLGKMS